MLKLNDFSFAHSGSENLINGFYLDLKPSQIAVLLGSNGVGKSSALNSIWEESFEKGQKVQLPISKVYFTQDVPADLILNPQKVNSSFYEILYEVWNEKLDSDKLLDWLSIVVNDIPKNFEARLEQNLFEMRLAPGFLSTKYRELSPGTKKRLLLSILFATDPKVILADELTNHLDTDSIQVVLGWLKNSQASVLLVDHNQEFLQSIGNYFIFLPNNKIRKPIYLPGLNFQEAMEYLANLEERQRDDLEEVEKKHRQLEAVKKEAQRQATVFDSTAAGRRVHAIEKRIDREILNNEIRFQQDIKKKVTFKAEENKNKIKPNLLINIDLLEFKIGVNKTQKIHGFKLYHGERLRITGPNGGGKSSLLRILEKYITDPLLLF